MRLSACVSSSVYACICACMGASSLLSKHETSTLQTDLEVQRPETSGIWINRRFRSILHAPIHAGSLSSSWQHKRTAAKTDDVLGICREGLLLSQARSCESSARKLSGCFVEAFVPRSLHVWPPWQHFVSVCSCQCMHNRWLRCRLLRTTQN